MAEQRREDLQDAAGEAQEPRQAEGGDQAAAQERKRPGIFSPVMLPGALVRISLGLLILGGMTTGTFFLVTDVIGPGLGDSTAQEGQRPPTQGVSEPGKPELPGDQFLVDQMTINPAETRGKRFLRLGVALETQGGPEVLEELETRKAQVRDLLIREFSSRNLDELTDPTVREELRIACVDQINSFLVGGSVSNLYFTDYVLQ